MRPYPLLLICAVLPAPAARAGVPRPCCAMLQPPNPIHAYLCGFHFYNGEPSRQVIAHHYCAEVGPEVMQCVVYDSNGKGARLVGVEYIVSARLFRTFPAEEKKLWHSHRYEVKSGQLMAPGSSLAAELSLMKELAPTYGKIWQTWQVDRNDQVPMGIPQLLMGFTADGQADARMVAERDRSLGGSTALRKAQRAELPAGPVDPGANAWERGAAVQLELGRGARGGCLEHP